MINYITAQRNCFLRQFYDIVTGSSFSASLTAKTSHFNSEHIRKMYRPLGTYPVLVDTFSAPSPQHLSFKNMPSTCASTPPHSSSGCPIRKQLKSNNFVHDPLNAMKFADAVAGTYKNLRKPYRVPTCNISIVLGEKVRKNANKCKKKKF